MKVDATVLAGGDGAVVDPTVGVKGLVPIAGKPMIQWVVEALHSADTVAEISVVLPTSENLGSWASMVDHLVVSDDSIIGNLIAGVESFGSGRHVLALTGDIPAVTPEAIDDFVRRSFDSSSDFSYPLIREVDMEAQFPGSQRTYVKVAGGKVTGGNMMLLSPGLVQRNQEIGQRLFDTRKSPVAMARVIGVPFIVKYVTGQLRVADVERKMGQLMGAKCAAVYTSYASIGADVDKPIDVVVTERVLYQRTLDAGSEPG
ncbi:MAG: NTP transferase domain-containing protein [Coriobacteriia bacterium]|nr:NTP transferase domain-containing protein [Coriobacteriia bacterium]